MAASLRSVVRRLEFLIDTLNSSIFGPGNRLRYGFDIATPSLSHGKLQQLTDPPTSSSFLDSLKDGFIWGVPKHRVSIRHRWNRWWSSHHMAGTRPRNDIITCLHCGHPHLRSALCGHCYGAVKKETKVIQDAMHITDRVPHNQEVAVLYEGETADPEKTKRMKMVQIPQKRPQWFSSNLLTKVIEGKS